MWLNPVKEYTEFKTLFFLMTFLKAGNIFKIKSLRKVSRPWPIITRGKLYDMQMTGSPFKEQASRPVPEAGWEGAGAEDLSVAITSPKLQSVSCHTIPWASRRGNNASSDTDAGSGAMQPTLPPTHLPSPAQQELTFWLMAMKDLQTPQKKNKRINRIKIHLCAGLLKVEKEIFWKHLKKPENKNIIWLAFFFGCTRS